ncbi:MAG: hypothetical protein JJU40_04765 [Rhodobacteraceae bacterium]|nr:hypothetical protein [Paracoccaceae bacterium]
MSNNDSFIQEVSEEVRRDRLYALARRWGWVGVVLVLLVVGAAAWREYSAQQERTSAQAFGDAVIAAFSEDADSARLHGLEAIAPRGPGQRAYLDLMRAAQLTQMGREEEALSLLDDFATRRDVPQIYRTLAGFRALMLRGPDMAASDLAAEWEAFAAPGQPFRPLALEQRALALIDAGQREAALDILRALPSDPQATAGLRRRVGQLIVALGETPPETGLPSQ